MATYQWVLGLLLLLGYAAGSWSGPGSLIALALAALNTLLAAGCNLKQPPQRFYQFIAKWLELLTHLMSFAVVARALSSTMTYIGLVPGHTDGLTILVVVVPTVLCALGLETSSFLRILLTVSIFGNLAFFLIMGILHADVSKWTEENYPISRWSGILFGTAVCSFGFPEFPEQKAKSAKTTNRFNYMHYLLITLACLLLYWTVSTILSLMVGQGALFGSAVPLLEAFEICDIDWARLVMATFAIVGFSLVLLEICSPLFSGIVTLAGEDWRIFPKILGMENQWSNTPALAIILAGAVASFFAYICPLWYLIQLMCLGPLVKSAVAAMLTIHHYYRYQPPKSIPPRSEDSHRSHKHGVTVHCLKSGLRFLHYPTDTYQHRLETSYLLDEIEVSGENNSIIKSVIKSNNTYRKKQECTDPQTSVNPVPQTSLNPTHTGSPSIKRVNRPTANITSQEENVSVMMDQNKPLVSQTVSINIRDFNKKSDSDYLNLASRSDNLNLQPSNKHGKDVNLTHIHTLQSCFSAQSCKALESLDQKHSRVPVNESYFYDTSMSEEESIYTSDEESDDEDDESNSTDIDAIVAEYKEKIKVATKQSYLEPSVRSSYNVIFALLGMTMSLCIVALVSSDSFKNGILCGILGIIGTITSLIIIIKQPRALTVHEQVPLVPWLPALTLASHVVLGMQLFKTVWLVLTVWIISGTMLYFRFTWKCQRPVLTGVPERIHLQSPPRHSIVSMLIPSHQHRSDSQSQRLTQVDTILISR